jgi:hypothetical protein
MSEPSLIDLKRSLLVQLLDYNKLEGSLASAEQINAMSNEEVERVANLLLELLHDLNELHDRIETMSALSERGDS